jgi:hypothetical protein
LIEVRQRGRKIYTAIKAGGKQSVRKLAQATALSKSSVQRYLQAWSKRVDPKRIEEKENEIAHHEDQLQSVRAAQEEYPNTLRGVSEAVHPFRLEDSAAQTAEQVESRLHERAEQFNELAEQQSIGDSRGALNTFNLSLLIPIKSTGYTAT